MYRMALGTSFHGVHRVTAGLFLLVGLVASPSLAQNRALLIGNSNYQPPNTPLPGDVLDVLAKHNALDSAGDWEVINDYDLIAEATLEQRGQGILGIIDEIKYWNPPSGKFYFVWFSGHGDNNPGQKGDLVGVDGVNVTPAEFLASITDPNYTFVKLDSCGSGAFANAVNALPGGAPIGFQTAVTGLDCSIGTDFGGLFTQCYVKGMDGRADGWVFDPLGNPINPIDNLLAVFDGMITVEEAAAYARRNCGPPAHIPYWNHKQGSLLIGRPKAPAGLCCLPDGRCIPNVAPEICRIKNAIVPTVSAWGVVVLALLTLTGLAFKFGRRRRVTA